MIESFTGRARYDLSIFAACTMFACYLLQVQVAETWFPGAGGVRMWLQRNLADKYLALSEHDYAKCASYAQETTRRAIETTAGQLTSQCYSGFHQILASTWAIWASLAYLFY